MRLVNIDDCDRKKFYKSLGGKNSLITIESAFDMFEALPVVDAKPVIYGHWNEYYTQNPGNVTFNCTDCGSTFIVIQGTDNMNLCPNCGVIMKNN